MKRSTIVRHLAEMTDTAQRIRGLWPEDEVVLRELWVGGDLVRPGDGVEHVVAILILDVPTAELPEIALHQAERGLAHLLALHKRPMIVRSRPTTRPPWSHLERRVARVWSATDGPDQRNLDGLRTRLLSGVDVVQPSDSELRGWLEVEIPRSESHLRVMLDDYWEGRWRKAHSGDGIHPDDHLWRASWAVQSMRDALAELLESDDV